KGSGQGPQLSARQILDMLSQLGSEAAPRSHVPTRSLNGDGLLDCIHCGLCLPVCPTYLATGLEMASPRGRIYMMRALREGQAELNATIVKHLDQCLGCLACQAACPSGVLYDHLLDAARREIDQQYERSPGDRRWRWVINRLFPYPRRLGWVLEGLSLYQRLGISRLVRASGALALCSPRLSQMEALLPTVPGRAERLPLPKVTPAIGRRIGRVGLLTGCVQRFLLPGINRATVRVLTEAGYDVVAPRDQACCGALHLHNGERERGRTMAKAMIATFEQAGVDVVAVNAAGCGATMKEYGQLFQEDAAWQARAGEFSAKVRDVSEILAEVSWNGKLRSVPLSVTYHEACHLVHAQGIRKEPRSVLRQIPDLRVVELPESDVCCGSAGVYNLLQPDMTAQLLQRKVECIRETKADFVAAGNIGCLLQIGLGLKQTGSPVRAVHPVELLDWSLHGTGLSAQRMGHRA
ncbi:MAG TPA: heterodisulfide reductase-related iron-sulfur binding cluster, partial [Candidatus Methylomirabilis sp.]|nr:heterodisulfide reductase-related iron-sulfur binding cluster [Candidatus Methylomirabilis sp.]